MPEDTVKVGRKGRAVAQTATSAKRRAATTNEKRGAGKAKADVNAGELILLVSRVAADFEALLKTKDTALSLSQWTMLETLSQEDGSSRPSQIARKLGFSRQLVRQATKKLLTLELVAKEAPEEGKKAVGLSLTDAGRKALAEIGTSTDAMSVALKAGKRGGNINQAARTLKGLSAAIPAKTASRGKGRQKKTGETDASPVEETAEA